MKTRGLSALIGGPSVFTSHLLTVAALIGLCQGEVGVGADIERGEVAAL